MQMYPADYVFGAALAYVIACNIYFGQRVTNDRIAMQWDISGRATWHAPKWVALWGMAAFMVAVRLLIWLTTVYAPSNVHGAQTGIVSLAVISATAHVFTLLKAR